MVQTRSGSLRGSLYIATACVFWALSGVLAKFLFAHRQLSPLMLVQHRMLLCSVILGLLMGWRCRDELRVRAADWGFFVAYALAGLTMVQLTYFTAVREGSVATAIFLQYLAPGMTAAWSVAVARRPSPAGLSGHLGLALGGSGLLLLGGAGGGLATTPLGAASGLASAACLSFCAIYGARGVAKYSPRTVLFYAMGLGAISLLPLAQPWRAWAGGAPGMAWTAVDWSFAVYLASFGTLAPFLLFLEGLRTVDPVPATLICMLEPVLATSLAWLFLGERLTLPQAAGGAMILVAIARLQRSRQAGAHQAATSDSRS